MARATNKPRLRRLVVAAAFVSLALGGAALMFYTSSGVPVPTITFAGIEPAGIFDDTGKEMWIVSFSVSANSNRPPGRILFAQQDGRTVDAKVGERWIEVDGMLWKDLAVYRGIGSVRILLLPAEAETCRIRLQYSRALLSEAQSVWLIKRLPASMQFGKVWLWLRDSSYKPYGGWHKITMEVPLQRPSPHPMGRGLSVESK